jgi:hypothetical protein
MSVGEQTSADATWAESYRGAARAAVGELDEIESVVMALEARLVTLRSRARTLTALLDVLQQVVPDAVTRPGPYAPDGPRGGDVTALPRRRRVRDRAPSALDDLPVRLGAGTRPTGATAPSADDVLGLAGDGGRAGATGPAARPDIDPVPADVEAWG